MCLTDAELDELETDIENLPDLYRGYQKALKAAHKMDYDDQLCFALQILRRCARGCGGVPQRQASISASMSRRIRQGAAWNYPRAGAGKRQYLYGRRRGPEHFTVSAPPTPRR